MHHGVLVVLESDTGCFLGLPPEWWNHNHIFYLLGSKILILQWSSAILWRGVSFSLASSHIRPRGCKGGSPKQKSHNVICKNQNFLQKQPAPPPKKKWIKNLLIHVSISIWYFKWTSQTKYKALIGAVWPLGTNWSDSAGPRNPPSWRIHRICESKSSQPGQRSSFALNTAPS